MLQLVGIGWRYGLADEREREGSCSSSYTRRAFVSVLWPFFQLFSFNEMRVKDPIQKKTMAEG
jgi:hypothetical protein